MKKLIILAVLAAMIFALAACAAPNEPTPTAKPVATEEPTKAAEVPTKEADPTPTEAPTPEPEPTDTPTPSPEPTAASIEKGTNVALTAEVDDYSSTTNDIYVQWGWSIDYINDGVIYDATVPNLGWTTDVKLNFDDPEQEDWITFELDKFTSIDTVNVVPVVGAPCFPVDFHIEVSLDGKTYTTVASIEGCTKAAKGDSSPAVLEFDPVTAKFVKFVVTRCYDVPSGNDGLLIQLSEIEIIAA